MLQLGPWFLGPPRAQALLVATPAEWQSINLERSGETQRRLGMAWQACCRGLRVVWPGRGRIKEGVHREK